MNALSAPRQAVVYPDTDGLPMADNTRQYEWMVALKGNIDAVFRDRPDVFVAGNHFIYPVEGDNQTCQAPDVYVAFDRPKGHRGSYQVWLEDGVFPQVVMEVLSPSNRPAELTRKRLWYERYGAREYYQYDPDDNWLAVWVRDDQGRLVEVNASAGWTSPLMRVRFDPTAEPMTVYRPDGTRFLTFDELDLEAAGWQREAELARREREAERERAEAAVRRAERERERADQAEERAEAAAAELARAKELLRQAGIDPDAVH